VAPPKYPPGYTLAQLRADRGLTQRAVGILAGISQGEVGFLERGLVTPKPATIVRLGKALGIAADTMQAILANSNGAAPTKTGRNGDAA
jgi:transcriptional regulator with XRE-family HTH domain